MNRALIWTIILCTTAIIGTLIYINTQPKQVEISIGGTSSQESNKLSAQRTMINNLRQLASGADQYFLEHGATRVSYGDIVGQDKYVRSIEPVAGESYPEYFEQGVPLKTTGGKYGPMSIDF